MKKVLNKIISTVLIVMMLVGLTTIVGLEVTPQAAASAVLSMNLVDESSDTVKISVVFESGNIGAIDFGINYSSAKIRSCTSISTNFPGGVAMTNPSTGLVSGAAAAGMNGNGSSIATYTFAKVPGQWVSRSDFTLTVSNCSDADMNIVNVSIRNNIPATPQNETTRPTTNPTTEPSTRPSTAPSTNPSTRPTDEPTTRPTSATTTSKVDDSKTESDVSKNSGSCGANATWVFDSTTGMLQVTGSGAMQDNVGSDAEWLKEYRDSIKEVKIHSGITHIGMNSFKNCPRLEKVYIASTVMSMGTGAFDGCPNLKQVYFEGTEEEFYAAFPQANEIFANSELVFEETSPEVWSEPDVIVDNPDDEDEVIDSLQTTGALSKQTVIIIIAVVVLVVIIAVVCIIVVSTKKKGNKKPKAKAVKPQQPVQNFNQVPVQNQVPAQNQVPVQNQIPVQNPNQVPVQYLNQVPVQNPNPNMYQNQEQVTVRLENPEAEQVTVKLPDNEFDNMQKTVPIQNDDVPPTVKL